MIKLPIYIAMRQKYINATTANNMLWQAQFAVNCINTVY